ncbi:alpha-crystallin domain-containing protein 22.3-like [Impatiens glandulifera]|uniref:alpha-crystallin domain-containing protein 22.3-like n=1 Tax=Impatiens glandulifera TaxID=253017 RepID=UPI001FB198D2|nr:alpha-crystallin domain-containing protein 22.3-like [Impatiens glandulifera]
MASPLRPLKRAKGSGRGSGSASRSQKKNNGGFYGNPFADPDQPILNVQPLNSVPFTGTLPEDPLAMDFDDVKEESEPAMIFLPSEPTEAQLREIVAAGHGFGVTGTAMRSKVGPSIGMMDIREDADTYYFRVSLPGVATTSDPMPSLYIQTNGKATIKGVSSTGKKNIHVGPRVFKMNSNNLCPPGPIELSFVLPGPIESGQFLGTFEKDGMLEGFAKKKKQDE